MTLSYLVSTAGHAQQQNEEHPHDIRSILQLIQEGAEELGSEEVVGFACKDGLEGRWTCNRYCESTSGPVATSADSAPIV